MKNQTHSYSGPGSEAAVKVAPPTQVESMIAVLGDSIDRAFKALELHKMKIAPVTMPETPSVAEKDTPPDAMLCGVADRIRSAARSVESLARQIECLTERTEA